jgi:hypothetical protein
MYTVLIVDPRKPFRSGIRVMLETVGHRVIEALDAWRCRRGSAG